MNRAESNQIESMIIRMIGSRTCSAAQAPAARVVQLGDMEQLKSAPSASVVTYSPTAAKPPQALMPHGCVTQLETKCFDLLAKFSQKIQPVTYLLRQISLWLGKVAGQDRKFSECTSCRRSRRSRSRQ